MTVRCAYRTRPSCKPVLCSECAVVVGWLGAFRTLFLPDRGHRIGRFAPNSVWARGVRGSAASRCTPRGRITNRVREGFRLLCMAWVRQWLLPLLLEPKFCLGPPGTARAARLYLGIKLEGIIISIRREMRPKAERGDGALGRASDIRHRNRNSAPMDVPMDVLYMCYSHDSLVAAAGLQLSAH